MRKRWKRAHRRRTPWGYTWRTLIAVPAWLVSLGVIWALATSFPLAFGAAGLIGGTVVTTGIVWAWVTGR